METGRLIASSYGLVRLWSGRLERVRHRGTSTSFSRSRNGTVFGVAGRLKKQILMRARRSIEHAREAAFGQYDRSLLRRGPFDEIECEFPAGSATKPRAKSIRNAHRERGRIDGVGCGREFGGCLDELPVGHAIAQADIHGSCRVDGSEGIVNGND